MVSKKNNSISISSEKNHSVVFTPSGLRGIVKSGVSVLDAARQLGVDLDSVCGGRGICTKCKVNPSFGNFSKFNITAEENNKLEGYPLEALTGPNTQSRDECERCAATLGLDVCHLVTLLSLESLYVQTKKL